MSQPNQNLKPILVLKFGGATLADSQKIRRAAERISVQAKTYRLIVAVSAMGQTTNQLIDLAHEVSSHPQLREMDMLLSVGERISMSLLSMALNDLGCPAISFTGSQAGILTDDSHINALILDIKPFRLEKALSDGKVVIVAGFQGVSPQTKEITTLGRGGTDTTAVAMAAYFKAERCDILKDVAGVFTADPKVVAKARPLKVLSYEALLEMTFWGAKVLHYRSVELAKIREVVLYIGPAANDLSEGTLVHKGKNMFETQQILSINSHAKVLRLQSSFSSISQALRTLQNECERLQIGFPQVLNAQESTPPAMDQITNQVTDQTLTQEILITGPQETVTALETEFAQPLAFRLDRVKLATVTLICTGSATPELIQKILSCLESNKIHCHGTVLSAMSISLIIDRAMREKAITCLHSLIELVGTEMK